MVSDSHRGSGGIPNDPTRAQPPELVVPVRTWKASTKATSDTSSTGASGKRSRPRVPRRNPSPMPRKLASSTKLVRCTR